MSIIEAIVLGIIQGFTEFLPVSSSGHLELAKVILGDTSVPEESLTFTVVLHFATALSTLVIFRKENFAVLVGISQAIAMLPGISRSGATISTCVLLGIDRTKAARFSFLMVVPLIFGKIGKDILSDDLNFQSSEIITISAGFMAAFVAGLLACKWMISLVKKSKLSYFSLYCAIVGILAISYTLFN